MVSACRGEVVKVFCTTSSLSFDCPCGPIMKQLQGNTSTAFLLLTLFALWRFSLFCLCYYPPVLFPLPSQGKKVERAGVAVASLGVLSCPITERSHQLPAPSKQGPANGFGWQAYIPIRPPFALSHTSQLFRPYFYANGFLLRENPPPLSSGCYVCWCAGLRRLVECDIRYSRWDGAHRPLSDSSSPCSRSSIKPQPLEADLSECHSQVVTLSCSSLATAASAALFHCKALLLSYRDWQNYTWLISPWSQGATNPDVWFRWRINEPHRSHCADVCVTSGRECSLMAGRLKLCLHGCFQKVNQGQQERF